MLSTWTQVPHFEQITLKHHPYFDIQEHIKLKDGEENPLQAFLCSYINFSTGKDHENKYLDSVLGAQEESTCVCD